MNAVMAERIRLIIDTEDVIRRAVQLRKVKSGEDKSVSEILNDLLRVEFAEEIAELELARGTPPTPPQPKRRPGRPRKTEGGE